MDIDKLTIEELKMGYRFDIETNSYICNTCGKEFEVGEVFPFDNRFFEASRAVKVHLNKEHDDYSKKLLHLESKYNTLTDNQKELLSLIYMDKSDKEIAKILEISTSTVRHHRFVFREKAKQAKMYLAIYEQVMDKKTSKEEKIVPLHNSATMVDDRYVITEKEREQVLKTVFESLSPLRLKNFPKKEKRKIVVLTKISEELELGKIYTEKELNNILKEIYDDYAVIRRYLIEYGFMDRTNDCKDYRLK